MGSNCRGVNASVARVSVGTASNAMARKSTVSVDLRDRVMRAAAEIGYSPNALAAGLRRQLAAQP